MSEYSSSYSTFCCFFKHYFPWPINLLPYFEGRGTPGRNQKAILVAVERHMMGDEF
jgi:hypothetical protein